MIAEEALIGLGFQVETAATAREALAACSTGFPDLAVIDVGLPDMPGDELARALRARQPGLPLLMASGYDAADVAGRMGVQDRLAVVAKPYTEADLADAIARLGLGA